MSKVRREPKKQAAYNNTHQYLPLVADEYGALPYELDRAPPTNTDVNIADEFVMSGGNAGVVPEQTKRMRLPLIPILIGGIVILVVWMRK
jgi:hypothetical protein